MKLRSTILGFAALALVAIVAVALMTPAPVHAGGAVQITGHFDGSPACDVSAFPPGMYDFAIILTGDLEGCHYIKVDRSEYSPSGTYREWGHEHFVGTYNGQFGTFDTTYMFTGKYEDPVNLVNEIFGRCQHPLVNGSGTGVFAGVSGRLHLKDAPLTYDGHLKW